MNRRKLFCFLSAAPVFSAGVYQSQLKSPEKPLTVTTGGTGASASDGLTLTLLPPIEMRLYSEWDYDIVRWAWVKQYLRDRLGDSWVVFEDWSGQGLAKCYVGGGKSVPYIEPLEAFATACLEGEIPGIYWAEPKKR